MTDMERFSIFLRYAENPDYREIVNRVIESREGLAVAGEMLMSISKDEQERAIFRNRRIALADQESNMITAKREAKREGYRESRREADEKWHSIVADKDAEIKDKDAKIEDKDAEIERLRAMLDEK